MERLKWRTTIVSRRAWLVLPHPGEEMQVCGRKKAAWMVTSMRAWSGVWDDFTRRQ
jgi:hypothetical protein